MFLWLVTALFGCSNSLKHTKFESIELDECFFYISDKSGVHYEPIITITKIEHFIGFENCSSETTDEEKNRIAQLLKSYDLVFTRSKIEDILFNTEYTKRDQCDHWKEVIDIRLSTESASNEKVNIYGIQPKNKYRHVLCP